MVNTIKYKNYIAELTVDTDDNIIIGRVINSEDIISFHGDTIADATKAFHDEIDLYLETIKLISGKD